MSLKVEWTACIHNFCSVVITSNVNVIRHATLLTLICSFCDVYHCSDCYQRLLIFILSSVATTSYIIIQVG